MKRRLLSTFLALCMILVLLPASVLAVSPGGTTPDGLQWVINDGVLTISGKGNMQDYEKSESGQGSLSSAPWASFSGQIHSVVIQDGVSSIGANAFLGIAIESVQISGTVASIGDYAFFTGANASLKQIQLNEGLKSIGRNAFAGALVESLTIPGTVESIGDFAFSHLPNLKEISFENGFETWENGEIGNAFSANYALNTVRFPASLSGLPEGAFNDCPSIHDIYYVGTEAAWNELVRQFDEVTSHYLLEKNKSTVHFVEMDPMDAFADISKGAWYYDAVRYSVREGLMRGTGRNQFSPNAGLTRGMVVTILWRMCEEPKPEQKSTFLDLQQEWYRDAAAWAQESGVVLGIDETHFAPEQAISRQDFVTILCRFLAAAGGKIETADLSGYPDMKAVSDYALIPMQWAVQKGIIAGNIIGGQTMLDPKGTTTRAQAAAIFMRFCEADFEFAAE